MSYGELSNTQETMVLPLLQMKNIRGKPYITVSAKGMINGLSNIPNDGADFGPDTTLNATAPGQYGSPYTETSGILEALEYNGNIKILQGTYQLSVYAYGSNYAAIYLNKNNISIEFEANVIINCSVPSGITVADIFYLAGTGTSPQNISITGNNCIIQGNWTKTAAFTLNAIHSQNTDNINLTQIEVEGVTIGILLQSCNNGSIQFINSYTGSTSTNCSINGLIFVETCSNMAIKNCYSLNSGDDTIFVGEGSSVINVSENIVIKNSLYGSIVTGRCINIYSDTADSTTSNISVHANYCVPSPVTSVEGITVFASSNTTIRDVIITDNIIDGMSLTPSGSSSYSCGIGVLSDLASGTVGSGNASVYRITITNNIVKNTGGPSIHFILNIPSSDSNDTFIEYIKICDNVFENPDVSNSSNNGFLWVQNDVSGTGQSTFAYISVYGNSFNQGAVSVYAYYVSSNPNNITGILFKFNEFINLTAFFTTTEGVELFSNMGYIASPTISANPPVTATVYQNTNPYDIRLKIPVTYSPTSFHVIL